ncbi:MAG: hypothetical protein AB9835_10635 [Eubacteriales bacterium]
MIKKLSMYVLAGCFVAFLYLGMAATIIKPKDTYSYYENRTYAPFPEISFSSIYEGNFFGGLEKFLVDHAALRTTLLRVKTEADLNLFRRPVVNEVVITDDILLPWIGYKYTDEQALAQNADAFVNTTASLARIVEDYGGYYCYVGVPCQYAYFEDDYPWFLENNSRLTGSVLPSFTKAADNYGLNFIDMGEVTRSLGHPEAFGSRVDNHYGIQGAYITYKAIIERINSDTGLGLSLPSEDEITFNKVPNYYVGSRTRKLMGLRGLGEGLYTASFDKDIPFSRVNNGNASASEVYSLPSSPDEGVLYSLYMGGDIAETVIDTGRDELPSVLIYGDSFTNPVECLAYYSFNEMRTLDLRHYDKMSLKDYVELYKPDVVICIRDYEAIAEWGGNGKVFG